MAPHWFNPGMVRDEEDLEIMREASEGDREWLFTCPVPAPIGDVDCAQGPELPVHVLLAEDDMDMRNLLAESLAGEGYLVTECSNGGQMLSHLSGLLDQRPVQPFDLIISDIRMPGLTGLEILGCLHDQGALPPIIVITAFGDDETHEAARRAGAAITLDKPFEVQALLATARRLLAQQHHA